MRTARLCIFGLILGGCADLIAPIDERVTACSSDADCENERFCFDDKCLRSSQPRCGDGEINGIEDCDDGNRSDADSCIGCRPAFCGDGHVWSAVEACDEAELNADDLPDRCRSDCQVARCGDGTIDSDEACDEGAENSNRTADACRLDCSLARCGDGVVDSDEDCDDTNTDERDACLGTCLAARCGDGILRNDVGREDADFEACDDGNNVDDDACDNNCGAGFIAISPSQDHTCVVKRSGQVFCWGSSNRLQLGDANRLPSHKPILVPIPDRATAIAGTHYRTCAVVESGALWCWGDYALHEANVDGDAVDVVGLYPEYFFVRTRQGHIRQIYGNGLPAHDPVAGMSDFSLTLRGLGHEASDYSLCAIDDQQTLWCWGDNTSGQVGSGSTDNYHAQPQRIALNRVLDVVHLTFETGKRTCAIAEDQDLYCWGAFDQGDVLLPFKMDGAPKLNRLFGGTQAQRSGDGALVGLNFQGRSIEPNISQTWFNLTTISGGGAQCLIDQYRAVHCKGRDNYGQTGLGATLRYRATQVQNLEPAQSVASGSRHSCALLRDDRVVCWGGLNNHTKRYRGISEHVSEGAAPTALDGGEALGLLRAGDEHSCALRQDNSIRCWGYQPRTQFFVSNNPIGDGARPSALSVGDRLACAVVAGEVWCWGLNHQGQTGQGDVEGSPTPARVVGLEGVVSVSAGGVAARQAAHACALTDNGEVWCWGGNDFGQMGHAQGTAQYFPLRVNLGFTAVELSAGGTHTCVRSATGSVHCWGGSANTTGLPEQLDDNDQVIRPRNSRFEAVPGITNAIQISAGGTSTCALLADATLRCWGAPAPVLGRRDHLTEAPVTPVGLPPVVQVDVGVRHACATTASGEVWCWGWNSTNMLGNLYRSTWSYQPIDRFDEAWIDGQ